MPLKGSRTAFLGARLLDPATGLDEIGDLIVDAPTIEAIGPDIFKTTKGSDIEIVNCHGLCLAPGLVDMRVQIREPGEEHKESIKSITEAAVSGGVTSMACLPNTQPVIDDQATFEYVSRRARKQGSAKIYAYGAATKGLKGDELAELGMLAEAGAVGFTDGVFAISNAQIMRQILSYASTFDLMVLQHPEEPELAKNGVMNRGELATRLGLSSIPREAEIVMLERDMRLVEMTGGRYHAAHISTSDSVEIIKKAKAKGLSVTCDTAPFYFGLNELSVSDYRTFSKLSPPLRAETDRLAIIDGLKNGVIDAIASDHAPQDQDSKRLPFAQAAFGGCGLETLLPISLELYHNGELTLLQTLKKLTCTPSKLLGLNSGSLAAGKPADLIIFDPNKAWKIDGDHFRSKSKNTPFDGRPVQGKVLKTLVDGRIVFENQGF
ncbi:MAG: dihydroorotase [Rhodospirillaceae bacterium]|nr:dihydroorotase [Rhodospirillaceae bacterium]